MHVNITHVLMMYITKHTYMCKQESITSFKEALTPVLSVHAAESQLITKFQVMPVKEKLLYMPFYFL